MTKIKCPTCGYENFNKTAKFCNECGAPLNAVEENTPENGKTPKTETSQMENKHESVSIPYGDLMAAPAEETKEAEPEKPSFDYESYNDDMMTEAGVTEDAPLEDIAEETDAPAEAEPQTEKKVVLVKKASVGKEARTAVVPQGLNPLFDGTNEALTDELTGLNNKRAYTNAFALAGQRDCAIIYFDINNLKLTNDTIGHRFGDELIITTATYIRELFGIENSFRTGGDEFIVLLNGVGPKVIESKLAKLRESMKMKTQKNTNGVVFEVACGYCVGDGVMSKIEIQDKAESQMYENKKGLKALADKQNGRVKQEEPVKKNNTYVEDDEDFEPVAVTLEEEQPVPKATGFDVNDAQREAVNPATDSYYDDVLPVIEEEISAIPRDIIAKGIAIFAAIFILAYYTLYQLS